VPVQSKTLRVGKNIFALLCVNAVIMYIDRSNLSIAAPIIQSEMGLSNVSIGAAFSAFSITYAGFMIVGGRIGDIIGPRMGLTICGILWAIGTISTGLVSGLRTLIAARLVVGAGESAVYPISSSVIARWIPAERRGSAQGIMHGCGRLGAALAPAAVTFLVLSFSWRWAFIILGAISLIMTVVISVFLRDDPRLHPSVTREELESLGHDDKKTARAEVMRSPPIVWPEFIAKVWPATMVSFIYGWFSWFLLSWVPLYFSREHGLDIKKVALFSTLVLIFGVLGMVSGGLATDLWLKRTGSLRRARRDTIIVSFLAALICIVPLVFTLDLLVDVVSLALGYFFIECADSSIWMLGMDVLPEHSATSTATVNTGFATAGAVSPIIVGWLLDVTQSWNDVFIISIVILLMGPVVVSFVRVHEVEDAALSQLRKVS
jgi:sugar phosphate permease